jgi:hypothetical protein
MKWLCEINVKSYLEIGCRNGGTFIVISEMLRRNNSDIKLIACDLIEESNTLKEYRKFRNFQYIQDSSKNQSFLNSIGNDIEMVFIDGDHSFAGCWGDWTNFSENKNTKYIAFHDIDSFACPDVGRVWETVSQIPTFSSTVFTNQYDPVLIPSGKNYLGLGILTRKNH